MLDQLKTTLRKIREDRKIEQLKNTLSYLDPNDQKKQQATLTLELPFSTNIADITKARATLYSENQNHLNERLKTPARQLVNEWKKSAKEPSYLDAFLDLLQQTGSAGYYHHCVTVNSPQPSGMIKIPLISTEEFLKLYPLEKMFHSIINSQLNDFMKELYKTYARDLRSFMGEGVSNYCTNFNKKDPLNIWEANKFFEYLEVRALKGTTERAFADIILCRALFYAPLPAKKLFSLPPPNKQNQILAVNDQTFRVPSSFITLWKNLQLPDKLFAREFSEDQLSKKIHRLGSYAELITPLNPTILRISLDSICQTDFGINQQIIELLPSR